MPQVEGVTNAKLLKALRPLYDKIFAFLSDDERLKTDAGEFYATLSNEEIGQLAVFGEQLHTLGDACCATARRESKRRKLIAPTYRQVYASLGL